MRTFDLALASLAQPENEPLNWLLGDFWRAKAQAPGPAHFLLRILANPRGDVLRRWNWWIEECRRLVINPEVLREKVKSDLSAGKGDADIKTRAVLAEILSVLHLAKMGYKNFEAVLPSRRSSPDFMAELNGIRARIEVKNLSEPQDWITKAAMARWEERSHAEPDKYRFRTVLNHSHRGSASEKAVNRLKSIVDQLPDINTSFEEMLDGDIHVRFEKQELKAEPEGFLEQKTHDRYLAGPQVSGYLSVITGIGFDNLQFDVAGFQALFLKALRVISEATPKFFSKAVEKVSLNVIVIHWETPDPLVDSEVPEQIEKPIEALFSNFGLELKVVIFWQEPQVPLQVLRGR
jgi:hypothetical protein